jgi:hypothetical protein
MSMSIQQANARIAELEAQLASKSKRSLSVKVSNKGGIMVLGLRQFPVTFYAEEWSKLFAMADEIKAFATANAKELAERQENPVESKSPVNARFRG